MNTDGYGGLAGFSGPALGDGSPVEVVRFQDLHRRHAPASAGLPEFGAVAEAQVEQAPLDAPMEYAGFAFGEVPSYGAFGYAGPSYEDLKSYPELSKGSSNTAKVKELQDALVAKGIMSAADLKGGYGTFGDKTKTAVETANVRASAGAVSDGTVRLFTWAYLFNVSAPAAASPSPAPATEREKAEAASKEAEKAVRKEADSLFSREALTDLFKGIGSGVSTTVESKREFERQKISLANENKPPEESKALTYALWGAGALLGIGAVILIVKAVSDDDDDDKSKKKEA